MGIHNFPGQPLPVSHHPPLPTCGLSSPSLSLYSLSRVLSPQFLTKPGTKVRSAIGRALAAVWRRGWRALPKCRHCLLIITEPPCRHKIPGLTQTKIRGLFFFSPLLSPQILATPQTLHPKIVINTPRSVSAFPALRAALRPGCQGPRELRARPCEEGNGHVSVSSPDTDTAGALRRSRRDEDGHAAAAPGQARRGSPARSRGPCGRSREVSAPCGRGGSRLSGREAGPGPGRAGGRDARLMDAPLLQESPRRDTDAPPNPPSPPSPLPPPLHPAPGKQREEKKTALSKVRGRERGAGAAPVGAGRGWRERLQ